jgi:hypothetical protein
VLDEKMRTRGLSLVVAVAVALLTGPIIGGLALAIYGLWSKRRWFLWVGLILLAYGLVASPALFSVPWLRSYSVGRG